MGKAYVLMADWDWEGQEAVEVFLLKERAEVACNNANEYNATRQYNNDRAGPIDSETWERNHPYSESARCRKFFVTEVPLDADQPA